MTKSVGYLSESTIVVARSPSRARWRFDLLFPAILVGTVFLIARVFFGF